MEFGLQRVNKMIADFRPIAGEYQNTPVAYSEGEHLALRATLATLWCETRQLLIFAREKRKKIEDENLTSQAWFNEIFRRLQELEKRPAVSYEGVYDPERQYEKGHLLTHDGSIFACLLPSKGITPGSAPAHFKLAVKRGRDGKDGKDLR
jgi:hypothetical protein